MRFRSAVYWGYLGALGACAASALGLVAASLLGHTTAGGTLQIAAGLELAAVGACVAFNWRNSARRLRARQRLDRRQRGDVFRWFCRDTKRWWRINGVVVMVGGFLLIALGIFTVRGYT
jgi:hypothetical protein